MCEVAMKTKLIVIVLCVLSFVVGMGVQYKNDEGSMFFALTLRPVDGTVSYQEAANFTVALFPLTYSNGAIMDMDTPHKFVSGHSACISLERKMNSSEVGKKELSSGYFYRCEPTTKANLTMLNWF